MTLLPIFNQPSPCAGKHELFDSTDYRDHAAAKALCATCPVFKECWDNLQDVLKADSSRGGSPAGTWAGMLYGQHGVRAKRPGCGTYRGYTAHRRNDETPCNDCKEARRLYYKKHRDRARGITDPGRDAASDVIDEAAITRVLAGEVIPTTTAERRLIMRRWIEAGNSEKSLCDRMGWRQGRYTPGEAA